jgi:hypothetical protein
VLGRRQPLVQLPGGVYQPVSPSSPKAEALTADAPLFGLADSDDMEV